MAASKPNAAELAGRLGDGLISTAPDAEVVERFEAAGGEGKPKLGQVTVCFAESEDDAKRTAHEWWPNAGIKGDLSQELALPRHFEDAAEMVSEDDVAEKSYAVLTPRSTSSRSSSTRTPASTTCICTRSGPTRKASSAWRRRNSCRGMRETEPP